jgi:hypothetical protein
VRGCVKVVHEQLFGHSIAPPQNQEKKGNSNGMEVNIGMSELSEARDVYKGKTSMSKEISLECTPFAPPTSALFVKHYPIRKVTQSPN